MRQVLSVMVAALALAGCYDSTHRRDADGDADGDIDDDLPRCAEPVICDALGFDVGFQFDVSAEVVTVEADRVVLLGADGVPQDYFTCGLDPRDLFATGDVVRMSHQEVEGDVECWSSLVVGEAGQLVAADCSAGALVVPPLPVPLNLSLEPACEGFTDHVCFPGSNPVHLDVPETVYDLVVTTPNSSTSRVGLGHTGAMGSWQVRLLDARSTAAMSERRCEAPATGRTALTLMGEGGAPLCPEPPGYERHMLGFPYMSASQFEMEMTVGGFTPEGVVLWGADGAEALYGWYGAAPALALDIGQQVVARRFDWDVTGSGFLDVLEVEDEVRLAVIARDGFSLDLPDLSVIGITLELGDPCVFDQGENECTGEVLTARRYPVQLFYEGSNVAVAYVGQTVEAGPFQATLIEAARYPGIDCPDGPSTEAWGPFGFTLLR